MEDYYINTSDYSPARKNITINQPHIVTTGQLQSTQPTQNISYPIFNQYKYNNNRFNVNFKDVLKRGVKYVVEGLAVAFVAYYFIGKGRLNIKDIIMLGITAAFVFAILDTFSPTISLGARFGAGFGIGQGLFGLNSVNPSSIIAAF